ncbi:MAG TPA: hypothetical protein VIF64_20590 [Pyrinomonadaceae bacterium]
MYFMIHATGYPAAPFAMQRAYTAPHRQRRRGRCGLAFANVTLWTLLAVVT